jgi:hypothetical protein
VGLNLIAAGLIGVRRIERGIPEPHRQLSGQRGGPATLFRNRRYPIMRRVTSDMPAKAATGQESIQHRGNHSRAVNGSLHALTGVKRQSARSIGAEHSRDPVVAVVNSRSRKAR